MEIRNIEHAVGTLLSKSIHDDEKLQSVVNEISKDIQTRLETLGIIDENSEEFVKSLPAIIKGSLGERPQLKDLTPDDLIRALQRETIRGIAEHAGIVFDKTSDHLEHDKKIVKLTKKIIPIAAKSILEDFQKEGVETVSAEDIEKKLSEAFFKIYKTSTTKHTSEIMYQIIKGYLSGISENKNTLHTQARKIMEAINKEVFKNKEEDKLYHSTRFQKSLYDEIAEEEELDESTLFKK